MEMTQEQLNKAAEEVMRELAIDKATFKDYEPYWVYNDFMIKASNKKVPQNHSSFIDYLDSLVN